MKKPIIFVLFGIAISSLLGAETVVTPVTTLSTPPALEVTVVPRISRALMKTPAEVRVFVRINQFGYVTEARVIQSTNPALNELCVEAVRQWRYKPAQLNGVIVGGSFIQPFTFSGDTFVFAADFSARPAVRRQVAPVVPETLKQISGLVTVGMQLDNIGRVLAIELVNSTHEELNEVALAAAGQWAFSPAYVKDRAVPVTVYVPFDFVGQAERMAKAILVDPSELKALRQVSPEVSAEVTGEAAVEIVIDQRGFVVEARVVSASKPELGEIARQATLKWKFAPVVRNGVAVPARAVQPFRFGEGTVAIARIDQLPKVRRSVAPELPASLQGASGFAKVVFEIDAEGKITSVEVTQASHAEFKAAVLVAARQWTFRPAVTAGQPTSARISVPFVFGGK